MRAGLVAAVLVVALGGACSAGPIRHIVPAGVPVDNDLTFASLDGALNTPGLTNGGIIYIEPGANPGPIDNSDFASAQAEANQGFYIIGRQQATVDEMQPIVVTDTVNITINNVQFNNCNIRFGNNAKFHVTGMQFIAFGCRLTCDESSPDGIIQCNGTVTFLGNNKIRTVGGTQVNIQSGATTFLAFHNEFTQMGQGNHIEYENGASNQRSDQIRGNHFIANTGGAGGSHLVVRAGIKGVQIAENVFVDADGGHSAITLENGVQDIQIISNRFQLAGFQLFGGIFLGFGQSGVPTTFLFSGNDFNLSQSSISMSVAAATTGFIDGVIHGNRVRSGTGIALSTGGVSLADVDLGGGTHSSIGGNIFRHFRNTATASSNAAIVGGSAAGSVTANSNVFAGSAPENFIWDDNDEGARIDVVPGTSRTGNEAFISTLYARFVRFPADFASSVFGGHDLQLLIDGKKPPVVAKKIIRSDRALGFLVDDVYHTVFHRGPEGAEIASALLKLRKAGKEEDLLVQMLSSNAARPYYPSDVSLGTKAYQLFLGRLPTDGERLAFNTLAAKSRRNALNSILKTDEFKVRRTNLVFDDLLGRAPTADEIKKYKVQDRLRLQTTIASLPEYFNSGY